MKAFVKVQSYGKRLKKRIFELKLTSYLTNLIYRKQAFV